jgi:hypothetical protein
MKRHRLMKASWITLLGFAGVANAAAGITREEGDPFSFSLSELITRDANLYRLPEEFDVAVMVPGGTATRDDLIYRTSAVIDGGWSMGKQEFALNVAVDNNRYADNSMLDNTSGNGRADWNWQLARDWSGQLGAGYGRSLAGFTNSRFFGKDVLENSDYHSAIRYELTPHWSLSAKGRYAEGSHDTDARRADNFESRSSTFGINYLTRRGDEMGVQYRRTTTTFPNELPGGGLFSDRGYVDRAATFETSYAFTVKTSFHGSLGYDWRHYPQSVIGDFAGPVWNAALRWEPRAKTRIEITQFQELTAYLDAESNHFEASGTRVALAWLPTTRLTMSFDVSREHHDYTGFEPDAFTGPARRDRLVSWQVSARYVPVSMLAFDLSYRFEQRETNRLLYAYDDRVISAGLTLLF